MTEMARRRLRHHSPGARTIAPWDSLVDFIVPDSEAGRESVDDAGQESAGGGDDDDNDKDGAAAGGHRDVKQRRLHSAERAHCGV